jgi:hypothetical protein
LKVPTLFEVSTLNAARLSRSEPRSKFCSYSAFVPDFWESIPTEQEKSVKEIRIHITSSVKNNKRK